MSTYKDRNKIPSTVFAISCMTSILVLLLPVYELKPDGDPFAALRIILGSQTEPNKMPISISIFDMLSIWVILLLFVTIILNIRNTHLSFTSHSKLIIGIPTFILFVIITNMLGTLPDNRPSDLYVKVWGYTMMVLTTGFTLLGTITDQILNRKPSSRNTGRSLYLT